MSILSKDQIKSNIESELADNNAGAISAYDVRHNMVDIVDSINHIVASGDFNATTPFLKDVRLAITGNQGGALIAESGVVFPIGGRQLVAYPGPGATSHNELSNLTAGDPHTQYVHINGSRPMINNLGLGNNWINSSGNVSLFSTNNRGLKFVYRNSSVEEIHIGSGTVSGSGSTFIFDNDNSTMSTAKGVAKAWLNFNGSGTPIINSFYNIKELQKIATGKYKVIFTSGTFGDNNYIAIGSSNFRSSASANVDFDVGKVGIVLREGNDSSALRSATFCVLNDAGEFVDAAINELVVYGIGPNEGSGTYPTVTVL